MDKIVIEEFSTNSLDLFKEKDFSKLKKINSFDEATNLLISSGSDNLKVIHLEKEEKDFYIIQVDEKLLGYVEGKDKYEALKQEIKQKAEKLKIDLEIVKVNLLKHQLDVQNNPKVPESKNVDFVIDKLSTYPLETLIVLLSKSFNLDSLGNSFLDNDELNKYRNSLKGEIVKRLLNANFNEKIKILEKIKSKDSSLFYLFAPYVVFSIQNKEQYTKIREKFNLKEIIKNTSIDADFVKLYKSAQTKKLTFNIPAQKADILMKKFSPDVENIVRKVSYLAITYQSIYGGIGNPNIIFEMLIDNLDKDDINSLDHILLTTGKLQNDFMKDAGDCIRKNGLLGCLYETVGASPGARSIANFAVVIGLIYGIFKVVRKNGLHGLLALLGGSWLLFGTKFGKEQLQKLHKLLYGPIDFDISSLSKKNIDRLTKLINKTDDSETDKLSILGFASIVFDGMKLKEIKQYTKEENGKIVDFDVEKFKQYLQSKEKYQILQIIEGMGDKVFKGTVIEALNLLNSKVNQNKKIQEIVSNKIKGIEKEKKIEDTSPTSFNEKISQAEVLLVSKEKKDSAESTDNIPNVIIDKKHYFTEKMFLQDGKYYLIGPDGNPKVISFEDLHPEIKEKLRQKELLLEKVNLLNFLFQAWCKKNKCEDKTKKKVEEKIQGLMEKLITDINASSIETEINGIIQDFAGKKSSEIAKLFKGEDKLKIRYNVLNYVRKELNGYELVANKIIGDNFDVSGLRKVMEELIEAVKNNNFSEIKSILAKNKLVKEYLTKNRKTTDDLAKKISNILEKVNKAKKELNIAKLAKEAGMKEKDYEDMLNYLIIKNSVKVALFNEFVDAITDEYGKLQDSKTFGKLKKELELYADIKGFGFWNLADKNIDIGKIVLETVLLELVALGAGALTAGAGAVAINSFVAARWAKTGKAIYDITKMSRIEKAFSVMNIGNKHYRVGKVKKVSYLLGTTVLEGVLFYEATNIVHNLIEGNEWFKGWSDGSEILKTMLMIGVLKGLGEVFKLSKLKIKEGEKLSNKILKFSSQITIEGTALGLTDLGISIVFDEGEWTPKAIAQGIMMALVYRLMGYSANKILVKRQGDKIFLGETNTSGKDLKGNTKIKKTENKEKKRKQLELFPKEEKKQKKEKNKTETKVKGSKIESKKIKVDKMKVKQISEKLKSLYESLGSKFPSKEIKVKEGVNKFKKYTFKEVIEFLKDGKIALKDIVINIPSKRVGNVKEHLKTEWQLVKNDPWMLFGTPVRVPMGVIKEVLGLGKDEISTALRFALTGRMEGSIKKPIGIGVLGMYGTYMMELLLENNFDVDKAWNEFTFAYPIKNPEEALPTYVAFAYFSRLGLVVEGGKLGYKKLTDKTIIVDPESNGIEGNTNN